MTPKALTALAAGLGCLGLLSLATGAALLVGGMASRAGSGGGLLSHLGGGERPSEADIEAALRRRWEREGTRNTPRVSFELHEMEIGGTQTATLQDAIDGVPQGGAVTAVYADYTVRTHYTDKTQAVRYRSEYKVYRDQFDKWITMLSGDRAEQVISDEPPSP